ncbi:hypothetical protein [Paraliomyxa miuraensis]|uniref:hypothetical protein n=1 Tax=Paraliomyxa miuraensis TaxID=376150 RepID=UPI002257A260|nr:hypothetical protein [Paraliomyxa miuraensis]MCX4241173.1 hypothetical protein [Paraliomyxa miuraensis]
MPTRDELNRCRYDGSDRGHYESWFQRANHPSRPLAFWIRYTIFSPAGRPNDAVGELWAIWFDRERRRIVAVKEVHPLAECELSRSGLSARIGAATLDDASLQGRAHHADHELQWSLRYAGDEAPLLLLPASLYEAALPKAKALVGTPLARYDGELHVDGERIEIDGWVGSQNHNWGRQHTDHYAWGQVAGFDDDPTAFLELSTARIRLGPLWTPFLTPLVLRLGGREHALNSVGRALRAHGRFRPFEWRFSSHGPEVRIEGTISAAASDFVALRYDDPPGGTKVCLNSKVAACRLLVEQPGQPPRRLETEYRAAFEILSDEAPDGISPVA